MLHVFDLDHTLFRVNSSFDFSFYLFRKGKLKFRSMAHIILIYLLHKIGLLSLEECHHRAFRTIFKGEERAVWTSYLPEYIDECYSRIVSPAVLSHLIKAQDRGEKTALFSSGPDFIVEYIANHFSISYIKSSKYGVDKEGRFVKISALLDGEGKRKALISLAGESKVPLPKVTVYSDSILDLPLLKLAGKAVCVEPDKALRKVAKQHEWEIINHEDTI